MPHLNQHIWCSTEPAFAPAVLRTAGAPRPETASSPSRAGHISAGPQVWSAGRAGPTPLVAGDAHLSPLDRRRAMYAEMRRLGRPQLRPTRRRLVLSDERIRPGVPPPSRGDCGGRLSDPHRPPGTVREGRGGERVEWLGGGFLGILGHSCVVSSIHV